MCVRPFLSSTAHLTDTPYFQVPTGGLFGNKAPEKLSTLGAFSSASPRIHLTFLQYQQMVSLVPPKIFPQIRKMGLLVNCLLSTCKCMLTTPASTGLFSASKDASTDKKDAPAGEYPFQPFLWFTHRTTSDHIFRIVRCIQRLRKEGHRKLGAWSTLDV